MQIFTSNKGVSMKYAMIIVIASFSFLAVATMKKNKTWKNYAVIRTMAEYEQACKATVPTVITFNSPTCNFCTQMEPHLNAAAGKYTRARFYVIENTKVEAFKELPTKVKIEGYPTTHFRVPGQEVRVERGAMSPQEIEDICYEITMGKKKPAPPAPKMKEQEKKPAASAAPAA